MSDPDDRLMGISMVGFDVRLLWGLMGCLNLPSQALVVGFERALFGGGEHSPRDGRWGLICSVGIAEYL